MFEDLPNVTETRINARTKCLRKDLYRFVVKKCQKLQSVFYSGIVP